MLHPGFLPNPTAGGRARPTAQLQPYPCHFPLCPLTWAGGVSRWATGLFPICPSGQEWEERGGKERQGGPATVSQSGLTLRKGAQTRACI